MTAGQRMQPERCSQELPRATSHVMGFRLAALEATPLQGLVRGYDQLLLYSVQGTCLTVEQKVLPAPRRFKTAGRIQLSADGELLAAIVCSAPYGDDAEQHLAVVCLVSGVVRVFSISPAVAPLLDLPLDEATVDLCWSANSTAVLVSITLLEQSGVSGQLFSFV